MVGPERRAHIERVAAQLDDWAGAMRVPEAERGRWLLAAWLHDALRFYVEFHRRRERLDGCVVNDILPIAALVRPEVMALRPSRVAVILDDGDDRGRTRGDKAGPEIAVAEQVRPDLVRQLLFERVLPSLAGAEAHS